MLCEFYWLWEKIEENCGYWSFYIKKHGYLFSSDLLVTAVADASAHSSPNSLRDNTRQWWILYPDTELLVQNAHTRCCHRGNSDHMLHGDLHWGNTMYEWGMLLDVPNRLFKLKYKDLSRYRYVMV